MTVEQHTQMSLYISIYLYIYHVSETPNHLHLYLAAYKMCRNFPFECSNCFDTVSLTKTRMKEELHFSSTCSTQYTAQVCVDSRYTGDGGTKKSFNWDKLKHQNRFSRYPGVHWSRNIS